MRVSLLLTRIHEPRARSKPDFNASSMFESFCYCVSPQGDLPSRSPVLTQVLCSGKRKPAVVARMTDCGAQSCALFSPVLPFILASIRPCWEFIFLPILQMQSLRPRRAHDVAKRREPGEPRVRGKARCCPKSCPQQAGSSVGD